MTLLASDSVVNNKNSSDVIFLDYSYMLPLWGKIIGIEKENIFAMIITRPQMFGYLYLKSADVVRCLLLIQTSVYFAALLRTDGRMIVIGKIKKSKQQGSV